MISFGFSDLEVVKIVAECNTFTIVFLEQKYKPNQIIMSYILASACLMAKNMLLVLF